MRFQHWDRSNGVPCAYLYRYVAKTFVPDVTAESRRIREDILHFKDGVMPAWLLEQLVAQLRQGADDLKDLTLVCIPASTRDANRRRFMVFSEQLCRATGMTNGFQYVSIVREKIPSHRGGRELGSYAYDQTFFNGRRVLLFDDVLTRGLSSGQVIRELQACGAKVEACLFIAKTYNPRLFPENDPIHPCTQTPVMRRKNARVETDDEFDWWAGSDSEDVVPGWLKMFARTTPDETTEKPTEKPKENPTKKTSSGSPISPWLTQTPNVSRERTMPVSTPTALEAPTLKVGDTLKFGRFQGRPLTWTVLDYKDDHWLVMTSRGITCRPYNDTLTHMTWEESALRAWLNGTFLEQSFSDAERARIRPTRIPAEVDEEHELHAGAETLDRVFILSISEYERYFLQTGRQWKCRIGDGTPRQCWLRNYGADRTRAAFVGRSGSVHAGGSLVDSARNAVRPLMWIKA